jgi:putative ABC transport system substrate-binding protein
MNVKRRQFITLLGGAAAAWPVAAQAQQAALPVIGHIGLGEPETQKDILAAFRRGLGEAGFTEGRNVIIEYRWAQNQPQRLPELAADLVRRNVAVIVANGGGVVAAAVKAATSTIPVVFEVGIDPVQTGLVASLSRPGGNMTGVNSLIGETWSKEFGLLTELLPNNRVFALLSGPNTQSTQERLLQEARSAADALGRKLLFIPVTTVQEIDEAFPSFVRQGANALVVRPSPLFYNRSQQLVALAARYSIPAIYAFRQSVVAGGLMSYGIDVLDSLRQVGVYTGRILKGEKPADLPVIQATKFEFVINMRTAKVLGLTVPNSMQLLADEVIE